MLLDYRKSILVCRKSGLCEYYPVCTTSYNHLMKPLRRKCVCKRSDNFKVILNRFFYNRKQFVQDDVMNSIRNEIHNRDNILYNYTIPITIPIESFSFKLRINVSCMCHEYIRNVSQM